MIADCADLDMIIKALTFCGVFYFFLAIKIVNLFPYV